jgi:hypothetical protein
MIAVYSENHMEPTNTFSGKNSELLKVKAGVAHTCQYALKSKAMQCAEHKTLQRNIQNL